MSGYTLGDLIYETRKQLGVTQEELAFGICSPGTLSKIENGLAVPKRRNYEALMQRLGKPSGSCEVCSSHRDMELHTMMREIIRKVAANDVQGAYDLLQEFRKAAGVEPLSAQFVLYISAIIHGKQGMEPERVLEKLYQALHMTVRDAKNYAAQRRHYTLDEIIILNNIAIQYQRQGELKKALRVLFWLKEYLEEREADDETKEKVYPLILYNTAALLYGKEIFHEALEVYDAGIDSCMRCGRYHLLPYLLHGKSACQSALGEPEKADISARQSEELFTLLAGHCEPPGALLCITL